MTRFLLLALTFTLISGVSYAQNCYTPKEAEAEQGIRIHSELMVIALNCAHMADANGNNLYSEYRKFTATHGGLFATYEKIMMANMQKNGASNAEAKMNAVRTDMAQKISNDAAKMRPDIFCDAYASRIEKVVKMKETMFRKWAATPFKGHPLSYPMCKA